MIHVDSGGGFCVTGVHVVLYRLLALRQGLTLEIAGMRRSGRSANAIVREEFGFRGNRAKVLEQLEQHIRERKEEIQLQATS